MAINDISFHTNCYRIWKYSHVLYFDAILLFKPQRFGGSQADLTHEEFIYFWIASIIAHASPPAGRDLKGGFSPRIFIVGTHRDSLPGSEAQKQAQVLWIQNNHHWCISAVITSLFPSNEFKLLRFHSYNSDLWFNKQFSPSARIYFCAVCCVL